MDDDTMLTTYDNPFSPFTQFEMWLKFDMIIGYNTCGELARRSFISSIYGDEANEEEIDRAMDEMIKEEPLVYKKVTRKDYPDMVEEVI